jgi:hypothetical protein
MTKYIIFLNVKNFPKITLFQEKFCAKENKEYFRIFWNIVFLKMETSKLINFMGRHAPKILG